MANGKRGAPFGNKNAAKHRVWYDNLKAELADYEDGDVTKGTALRRIANVVIRNALSGDTFCIKEIGDRMDGRAPIAPIPGMDNAADLLQQAIIRALSPEDKDV